MTTSPVADPEASAAPKHSPLLQLRGVSKHFGAVQALSAVDVEVCSLPCLLALDASDIAAFAG